MKLTDIIYIAGHRGLAGSAIWRHLEKAGYQNLVGLSSAELDLTNRDAVFQAIQRISPDVVIDAAAKVGGIHANDTYPAEFLSDNLQIQVNLMDAANAAGVDRLFFLGSSCIYPKFAQQPIAESSLLTGELEETNSAYGIAKIAGILQVQAVIWGTGTPLREFLHVDDLASAVEFLLQHYDEPGTINIGSGQEVSISELASLISEVVGFEGAITQDPSRPDGTPRKVLDSSRLHDLGWTPSWTLREGIEDAYRWFVENHEKLRSV